MKKKLLLVFTSFLTIFNMTANVYLNTYAMESAVSVAGLGAGESLLGLLALSGVGMELENNKNFNELTDTEKYRLRNGLAKDFRDVALQRGMALEDINSWLNDVGQGILDKSSVAWDTFKDWATSINLTESSFDNSLVNGQPMSPELLIGMSFNYNNNIRTIDNNGVNLIKTAFNINENNNPYIGWIIYTGNTLDGRVIYVSGIANSNVDTISESSSVTTYKFGSSFPNNSWYQYNGSSNVGNKAINADIVICSKPVIIGGVDYNGKGSLVTDIFSTNTDYLDVLTRERGTIIDITDVKNPIIEGERNEIARIDWGGGSNRKPDNEDDDKNELVWADVTWSKIDEIQGQQQQALEDFNDKVDEEPENETTTYISPLPITNIYNYWNVLPVVEIPQSGTIVNYNYTYNNYNTTNNTIYEEPYNSNLIPTFGMIFENKFPFCIPFDIYSFIKIFYAEREAPHITIPFPYMDSGNLVTQDIELSLADYEYVSEIFRVMFYILFIIGLMLMTRGLIKG